MPEPTPIFNLADERERRSRPLKPRYQLALLRDVIDLLDADAEQFSAVFEALVGGERAPALVAQFVEASIGIVIMAPDLTLKIVSKGVEWEVDFPRLNQELAAAGPATDSQHGRAKQLRLALSRVLSRPVADELGKLRKLLALGETPHHGD